MIYKRILILKESSIGIKSVVTCFLLMLVIVHNIACSVNSDSPEMTVTPILTTEPLQGKIAFFSDRDGDLEVYIMNADGSNQMNLTNNSERDFLPCLSPDGTQLAFTSNREGNEDIYIMHLSDFSIRKLTNLEDTDGAASWSPDMSKIVFEQKNTWGDEAEIYVIESDGSNLINISNNAAYDSHPSWSPDGTKVAFSSNRDGNFEIYTMNIDGSDVVRLTHSLEQWDDFPKWSPDGKTILFHSEGMECIGFSQVMLMNMDGSNASNLTDHASENAIPCFSPDGTKIAFSSNRDGSFDIYTMDIDGSNVIRLTNDSSTNIYCTWAP